MSEGAGLKDGLFDLRGRGWRLLRDDLVFSQDVVPVWSLVSIADGDLGRKVIVPLGVRIGIVDGHIDAFIHGSCHDWKEG